MLELVFETHALTTDNEAGIATGWLPGELSEEGRRQAELLGKRRRDVDAVFASDLRRAVETVEIAFAGSAIPVFFDRRLRECDYGELNGAQFETVARARRQHIEIPFAGGESYADVVARTRLFLDDLRTSWDERRVCVVSHSANRWALEHLLQGKALEDLVDAPFEWREGWLFRV